MQMINSELIFALTCISGFLTSRDKIANKINVKILKKLKPNLNKLILINAFDALKA